jgi:AbrB family looped-hinge helix DNA binding protein
MKNTTPAPPRRPSKARIVRPLRRGQVTLPQDFRRRLGIGDDTLLEIRLEGDRIEIRPMVAQPATGSAWARELYQRFAPVREDLAIRGEEEIDELIGETVKEVRSKPRD